MKVSEALQSRFTCRGFKQDPVDTGLITQILEKASRAPSWSNSQPWEVFVAAGESLNRLREAFMKASQANQPLSADQPVPQQWPENIAKRMADLREERARVTGIGPDNPQAMQAMKENIFRFFGAPAVIYLCMDRTLTPWSMFDLGALSQSIMLAARELGIDSAPAVMLVIYPELVRSELEIPDNLSVIFGIALGYCDPDHPQSYFRSSRRPVEEFVTIKS